MHQASLRHGKLVAILRVVSCGLLLLMITNGSAETIDVVPKWKKGQTLSYKLVKSRTRTKSGKTTLKSGATSDVTLKVDQAGSDGYLIRWIISKPKLDGSAPVFDPAQGEFSQLLNDFEMQLEFDAEVTFKGIKNWEQVRQKVLLAVEALAKGAEKQGNDPGEFEKIRPIVAKLFETKQQVEMICAREAQMFFMPLGGSFDVGAPREYDDLIPNPFGGDPFPSRGSVLVKSADKKRGDATLVWKQSLDPTKAAEVLAKTMADLAERVGKPIPEGERIKSISIDDLSEFKLDLRTGWVRELVHTRTILR